MLCAELLASKCSPSKREKRKAFSNFKLGSNINKSQDQIENQSKTAYILEKLKATSLARLPE